MNRIVLLVLSFIFSIVASAQRDCGSVDYQDQIKAGLAAYQQAGLLPATPQATTNSSLQTASAGSVSKASSSVIAIPVVIHVLYNTNAQNISDAQIASQITVLNNDYNGRNSDRSKVPAYFAPLIGNTAFEFRLANVDVNGNATPGIVRKYTSVQMFGTDDRIKFSSLGGDDAWDRNRYLNIWIGNLAGTVMGYSSIPGSPAEKDGVVISYSAFGTMGTAAAPFNLGRTATHEIGHWMNLVHIWGDTYCGDDQVDDTPKQRTSNKGCPSGEKFSCEQNAHGDMYMNFMDLTNDACMDMFTVGQCNRMRALFERGGARYALLFSLGLSGKTINQSTMPAEIPVNIEVSNSFVSVYPNPASSAITVETTGMTESEKKRLMMYNGVGQPVMNIELTSAKVQVDISKLHTGIYFIKLTNGSMEKMVKFCKN